MISQETIDRVRQQTNIVELIGESVKLERRGRSFVGLCPFHNEKTPSFHVNDERGYYYCFGCRASGDALKYVQQTEGLEFAEAVRRLAERLNIEVVDDLSDQERRQQAAAKRREQALFDVNAAAAVYFEKMLTSHEHSRFAHEELHRRGLPYDGPARPILEAFRVGYAPEGWEGLVQYLRRVGLDLSAAEKVGLLAPRRQGSGHYDRFRHRLMFAVLDLQGRVVAFSGRTLDPVTPPRDGDPPAKYINSPESPIYKKRETVFGLYQARTALRGGEPCVLVEGNFDVVSLHARGIPGAVAPLGTAFTAEQGRQIRRFTQTVTFLFDGDAAGKKAVAASREPAHSAGLTARVATLPQGTDPDDFSREKGEAGIRAVVRAARGMLEHLIEEALDESFAGSDPQARAAKLKEVTALLASEDDPAVRALAEQHADRIAGRLGVADARTFRALQSAVRASLERPARREMTRAPLDAPARARSRARLKDITAEIVGALLDFPELLDTEEVLAYAEQVEGDLAAALAALRQSHGGRNVLDMELALAKMPESIQPFAEQRMAAPRHARMEDAKAELLGNVNKLKRYELSRLTSEALGELEQARRTGDFDQELDLLLQTQLRAKRRHGL